MLEWKIFYSDGSEFSNQDGDPSQAPGDGVIAIAQRDMEADPFIHQGSDFYLFDLDLFEGWGGVDQFGLAQYLSEPGYKIIKMGRLIGTEKWKRLLAKVRSDPGLGEKTARRHWERELS